MNAADAAAFAAIIGGAGPDDAERTQTNSPAQTLPLEVLALAFAFLDAPDVPAVSAACSGWKSALRDAERDGSMWLNLVRKHHPVLEQQIEMTIGSANNSNGIDWKAQFCRMRALVSRVGESTEESASNAEPNDPPPRPLSSYVARIDLVCYKRGLSKPVRIVSRVFDDLSYTNKKIEFPEIDFYDDLSSLDFHYFAVSISLVEKSTGRQTLLHYGKIIAWDEENIACFDFFTNHHVHPIVRRLQTDFWYYESELVLERSGCMDWCSSASGASGDPPFNTDELQRFFALPSTAICSCGVCHYSRCSCYNKWRCLYRYKMVLRLFKDPEAFQDAPSMYESEALAFLQDALVYT